MNLQILSDGPQTEGSWTVLAVVFFFGIVLLTALLVWHITMPQQASVQASLDAHHMLKGMGWDISEQPIAEERLTLPSQFDAVYVQYNQLQQQAGYDLSPYRGQTVVRQTYEVYNHPSERRVLCNLLIYGGKVIGGDIMCPAIDGFMQPLRGETDEIQ